MDRALTSAAVRALLFSYLLLSRPMARIIIAVTVVGRYPDYATARRISVVTADPDPCSVDPLVMTGDPDGAAIGARPGMFHDNRRGSDADLNSHIGGRGLARGDKRHDDGDKRQRSQTKRSDSHRAF